MKIHGKSLRCYTKGIFSSIISSRYIINNRSRYINLEKHKKLSCAERDLLVNYTMKVGFYTLGCKVNQYETQAMEQLFAARGYTVGDFHSLCDIYIVNTCSVTAVADKKNRAVIRRCRREKSGECFGGLRLLSPARNGQAAGNGH